MRMTQWSRGSQTASVAARRRRRCGALLVELIVALAVTGVLAGVSFRLVDRTHRFSRGMALLLEERAQLAAAASVVRGALEEIAPLDGDLAATADSSVVFDGAVGHAIACATATSAIDVPTTTLASQLVLTAWSTAPQAGDVVAVLDDGTLPGAQDDVWERRTVAAVQSLPNACQTTPLIDSIADAGSVGWRLVLAAPIPSTVHAGVPVHVVRRQRFALYRSGAEWMLGWTEWNPAGGGWNVIQPLAGPLLPYAPPSGASGLTFAWRDSTGAMTSLPGGSVPTAATIAVRGPTRAPVRVDGMRAGVHLDSLGVRVAARNRR